VAVLRLSHDLPFVASAGHSGSLQLVTKRLHFFAGDGININKQIHLVGERFILKIHQNTTNDSYFVDVSVSDRGPVLIILNFSNFNSFFAVCCFREHKMLLNSPMSIFRCWVRVCSIVSSLQ